MPESLIENNQFTVNNKIRPVNETRAFKVTFYDYLEVTFVTLRNNYIVYRNTTWMTELVSNVLIN